MFIMENEYEKQAEDFLKSTNTELIVEFKEYGTYFDDDEEERDIYNVTLKRGDKSYTFTFGQSINDSGNKKPTPYDILACLTTYEVGTFDDFCSEFGYNEKPLSEYPKVKKIYDKVCSEVKNLNILYSEKELEQLQEIQ